MPRRLIEIEIYVRKKNWLLIELLARFLQVILLVLIDVLFKWWYAHWLTVLLPCRVQREQIIAKQQELETARLKNSGRAPKGKDGLRPESPHSRRPRRPPVKKMIQANKNKFDVSHVCFLVSEIIQLSVRHVLWLVTSLEMENLHPSCQVISSLA